MTEPTPDLDLFISHASVDDAAVSHIDAALNAAGLTTWVDHEHGITYGDRWMAAIDEATLRCRACLYVLTPESARSQWCLRELTRIGEQLKRKIYVALLRPLPAWQIPMLVNDVQYADLTTAAVADPADPTLRALCDAIQGRRRFEKTLVSEQRTQRVTGAYPYNETIYTLYGRDADLGTLRDALAPAPATPVVMLLGLGGVGKTRLAVEVVETLDLRDGAVWFAFDRAVSDAENSTARCAEVVREHLGLPPTAGEEAAWAAINGRELLLVLDNAEDCPGPARAAFARRLRALRGGPRVLFTSRHAWEEIGSARPHDLHAPSPEDGEKILRRMAEVRGYAERLNGQAAALAGAARQHPRLMLYAVGWLKAHQPQVVIQALTGLKGREIEKALGEMVGRTLEQMTAIEGPDALAALRRLTVTRGGFTYEAAAALLAEQAADDPMLSSLTTLAAWNLIEYTDGRYNIDPLVRAAAGEDDDARRAHYDHYRAVAAAAEAAQHDPLRYQKLEVESANLEAAFEWALAHAPEDGYRLFNRMTLYLANRGRFGQRLEWVDRVQAALGDSTDERLKATVANDVGIVYQDHPLGDRRANLERAIAAYQEALRFRTADAAPLDYATTQNNLGTAYWNLAPLEGADTQVGTLQRAIAAYQEALRFRTADAAPLYYAGTQNNLGNAYLDLARLEGADTRVGTLQRAIAAYQEALRFRTADAAPLDYAMTQNNLGNAYWNLAGLEGADTQVGTLQRAIDDYQEALRFWTADAAPLYYAGTQNNLGTAYRNLAGLEGADTRVGTLQRAIAAYQEALRFRTADAAPLDYAMTQYNLGNAYGDLALTLPEGLPSVANPSPSGLRTGQF